MREILFRGKSISTSKWVYGWLITGIYGAAKPIIVTDSDYDDNNIVNIDYDFILRTNLSTYINVPAVLNIINSYIMPQCLVKNFFGGELLSTVTGGQELLFFRGNFMLFNRIQIKFILKNKNFNHTTETDDAVIGSIFSGYFVYQPLKFGLLYSYSG